MHLYICMDNFFTKNVESEIELSILDHWAFLGTELHVFHNMLCNQSYFTINIKL